MRRFGLAGRKLTSVLKARSRRDAMSVKRPEPITPQMIKTRPCLKCGKTFESGWSGERVCVSCKTSAAWRQAAAQSLD